MATPYLLLSILTLFLAVLSPVLIPLLNTLGFFRFSVQNISEYPYQCERVSQISPAGGLGLEGCEDLWLHAPSGWLYLACSEAELRRQWIPSLAVFNDSGRGLTDKIYAMDTRGTGDIQDRVKAVRPVGFTGNNGDGSLNLNGFDVEIVEGPEGELPTLKLLLVNHRPSLDPSTGKLLDATKVGANSTIELFETTLGAGEMLHKRTYAHEAIEIPNSVAFVGDGAFVLTNDRSAKTGLRRELDPILGGGTVAYCNDTSCSIAVSSGMTCPNGLVRGQDDLIYVPSSVTGEIYVMALQPDHRLKQVASIKVPLPVDNLSVDEYGDIYAATFPQLYIFMRAFTKPHEINPPTAVFRVRKTGEDYEVKKVLEDNGSVLPGATTAIHDARTGRYFLGGTVAPYITICTPL